MHKLQTGSFLLFSLLLQFLFPISPIISQTLFLSSVCMHIYISALLRSIFVHTSLLFSSQSACQHVARIFSLFCSSVLFSLFHKIMIPSSFCSPSVLTPSVERCQKQLETLQHRNSSRGANRAIDNTFCHFAILSDGPLLLHLPLSILSHLFCCQQCIYMR